VIFKIVYFLVSERLYLVIEVTPGIFMLNFTNMREVTLSTKKWWGGGGQGTPGLIYTEG